VNYNVSCGVMALSSGSAIGLATQWSRVTEGMGDRLWADKPPHWFTKPARPTQPPTLSGWEM